ncbi:PREDICTED: homeobox protein 5 [Ceratosolen solmsi marchali]|uniref:Homeobox protein 5 n=1 Tax=Ceratosolen solmsi marchali TaxID=326594 RepID=A0AAJ6VME5_9HYME|nr:PREDICTED: homeobox protein 5 [Ceratosolen solmsi marchali]
MSVESQGWSTPTTCELAKVKKEQLELLTDCRSTSDTKIELQQRHPPPPLRLNNGFYSGDLIQDILKASKFNSFAHHTPAAKHEKIRLMIEDSISEESRSRVQEIFSQVEQLKLEEKLLLYLKLPISLTNTNGVVDPLKQPLNPLGNRYEIHQTIMWIKTHLEEDPEVSLPKQEVYDEYNIFCSKNSMKPLSTADFGKVMKQVYPRVRPRRLGTRGNSRYCYAGMRKRIKLDPPILPITSCTDMIEDIEYNVTEDMLGAASTLIREWAETLLDVKFPTLCSLGKYLVNNLCVDSRSLAAVCILSASTEPQFVTNKVTSSGLQVIPVSVKTGKLREAQLQLQRKLQEREHIRDQKHEHLKSILQSEDKEKIIVPNIESFGVGEKKAKKTKISLNNLEQGTNGLNKVIMTTVVSAGRQKKNLKNNRSCSVSLQSNCDNLIVQPIQDEQNSNTSKLIKNDIVILPKENKLKTIRKRSNSNVVTQVSNSSPEKQFKLSDENMILRSRLSSTSIQQSTKISVILANDMKNAMKNNKSNNSVAAVTNHSLKNCNKESPVCFNDDSKLNGYFNGSDLTNKTKTLKSGAHPLQKSSNAFIKDKFCSIDTDALYDYLNGGNNSQEQEEELLQYFQQSNSSSSDVELSMVSDTEQNSRQDKVSQLRIILQENLKDSVLSGNKVKLQNIPLDKQQVLQKHNLILPTLLNHNTLNPRRRVSFETNIINNNQNNSNGNNSNNVNINGNGNHYIGSNSINSFHNNTIPQSPNTRRRIFNFTPISPGPHSPINGRVSKSSSANASPFVSPRNTPVPRSKSNLQGSYRSRGSQKILSRSMSCNVACSINRNNTFIVPTSGSELIRQVNSPLISVSNKVSQAPQVLQLVHTYEDKLQRSDSLACDAPFLTDLAPQEAQLLINYPSQENLQEIKNIYQKHQPTDQEISDLLQNEKQQYCKEQVFYRSQSVPLHRMVNPAILSPISTQLTSNIFSHSFNPSTSSSIAPTPVPSEFNDFNSIGPCNGSSYLLDVNPLMTNNQHFIMEDKEIIPENLSNIFEMLNGEEPEIISEDAVNKEEDSNPIIMSPLPSSNLNNSILLEDSSALLETWTNGTNVNNETAIINNTPKLLHSRSYPNTPLPLPNHSFTLQYPEDSNGSRSYPTTPVHNMQQESYRENNEPMLFSPTLNTLSLHNQSANINSASSTSVECNMADFLEPDLPNDQNDDLGSLSNFEGLQDVGTLSPLFTEVVESNH